MIVFNSALDVFMESILFTPNLISEIRSFTVFFIAVRTCTRAVILGSVAPEAFRFVMTISIRATK